MKMHMHAKFLSEVLKERSHSEDLGIDVRVVLKVYFKEIGWVTVCCIKLAQDSHWLWAVVNMVMNLQVL